MSKDKLTAKQVQLLEPYENYFVTAIRSGYCSYPGEAGLKLFRDIWAELTGQVYPFRAGCSDCIMNLVRDMGTLYFAERPERNPFFVRPEVTKEPAPKPAPAKEPKPALTPEQKAAKRSEAAKKAAATRAAKKAAKK